MTSRYIIAALLLLTGLAGGAWFFSKAFNPPAAAPLSATVLPTPRQLAAFELVGDDGEAFTNSDLRGHWSLLFFGFTHCPDICPATLQQLSLARRQLAAADNEPLPGILFISVDPARDSVATLADYVANFGDGVRGVTGEPDKLRALTRDLGIHFEVATETDENGNYDVSHSSAVLLINPEAELQAVFSAPHAIDNFVNDLPQIMTAR